jgi:hypothetical protein
MGRKFAFQAITSKPKLQIDHTFLYLQTCQGMPKVWEVSKCLDLYLYLLVPYL